MVACVASHATRRIRQCYCQFASNNIMHNCPLHRAAAAIGVMATVSGAELWWHKAVQRQDWLGVTLAVAAGAAAFALLDPLLPKPPEPHHLLLDEADKQVGWQGVWTDTDGMLYAVADAAAVHMYQVVASTDSSTYSLISNCRGVSTMVVLEN
jgi:hypothetical protein